MLGKQTKPDPTVDVRSSLQLDIRILRRLSGEAEVYECLASEASVQIEKVKLIFDGGAEPGDLEGLTVGELGRVQDVIRADLRVIVNNSPRARSKT